VILIDTSAWVDFFRGAEPFASAVDTVVESGEAALCGPVLTELRRGLRASHRARVLPLLDGCHLLSQPEDLWLAAGDLGALLARKGVTVKTLDLLIATYAIAHDTRVLAVDSDFRAMAKANVGVALVR
jgi:predicted nucleic acid-binding protein